MSNRKKNKVARQSPPKIQAVPKSVQERQLRTLRAIQMSTRITSGPIPSADEMMRYQQVQRDLPERIMRQFERRTERAELQGEHRMRMENRVINNNILMERLGWGSATTFGLVVLVGSLGLVYAGKSLEGLAGVTVALATLLGLWIFSRKEQIQELTKKRAAELLRKGTTPEQLNSLPQNGED